MANPMTWIFTFHGKGYSIRKIANVNSKFDSPQYRKNDDYDRRVWNSRFLRYFTNGVLFFIKNKNLYVTI